MSTLRWIGGAPAVQKEMRATPADVEVGDVFTLTINGRSISYTAAAATVADVTAGLVAAWNASTQPEFAEITASDETTYIGLLSDAAGIDFNVTGSTTDGGGTDDQTLTVTTETEASGPYHWNDPLNWDGGAIPANSDTVILEHCPATTQILYGLDQSAVTLTKLEIRASFLGKIGLPARNGNLYTEYRDRYLQIGATTLVVGEGSGNGSPRLNIDNGSVETALTVHKTGTSDTTDLPAMLWKGTHADNEVFVRKGDVGIAYLAAETATVSGLTLGHAANQNTDANVVAKSGTTLGDVFQYGGTLETNSGMTNVYHEAGTHTHIAGTIAALRAYSGTIYYRSAGTLTSLHLGSNAVFDCSLDPTARTVSYAYAYAGATIRDPYQTVTWGDGIDLIRAGLQDVNFDLGTQIMIEPRPDLTSRVFRVQGSVLNQNPEP